jgi:CHAD domain-containing protein
MLEEERKYEVGPDFPVPDLSGCAPAGGRVVARVPITLKATYYDTADLRLARAGVSLRYRRGDDIPWTVKLPTDSPGARTEISRRGAPGTIPSELLALVTVWRRGSPLHPAAVVRTVRRRYDVCDASDIVLAEIADDAVSVLDGRKTVSRFRELEVERKAGDPRLLDRVERVLRSAGAERGEFTPKHVRALGPAAAEPPDLPPPEPPRPTATAGDVAVAAIRRAVGRIFAHDPLVRLREPVGKDDTAVHQMRVGCRRLRSDLRTFRRLLDRAWAARIREDAAWLAELLGAARDAEVLRARLRQTASADPLAPLDEPSVARIDAELAARHEDALVALDKSLASDRYLSLVDLLLSAAQSPVLTALARAPATEVLPRLVAKPFRQLAHGKSSGSAGESVGAEDLDPAAPDEVWHGVRIRGKRARYAVEAVAPVLGGAAAGLASALAKVQDLLGEHQDAAVAASTWLAVAQSDPDDHLLAVTAGRLVERERASVRTVRSAFPAAWQAASRRRLTSWLS